MVNPSGLGRRAASLGLVGLAAGCTGLPPPPVTTLPVDPTLGFADPTRQAIIHAAYVFPQPATMQGNPVRAAQAISEVEHLAVELRHGPRWIEMSPLVTQAFGQAREEWRGALGIAPQAQPQAVIDAMTAVRLALGAQNAAGAAAALQPPLVTPGGAASLQRLAELPPLPRTAQASQMALQEMWRIQRQDSRNRPWL